MELRHLRYFIAAAEEEHFGRASDKLHVTRPAVSKIIADLEGELGMQLFERQGHRVTLTPAGRKLLPDVTAVMHTLTDAFAEAKKVSQGKLGTLSVGYGTLTLHNNVFRDTIKRFKERRPDVSLRLVELSTFEQPKALSEGRIHVGFMHFGSLRAPARRRGRPLLAMQDESVLECHTIDTGRLGVVMEASHPLAAKKQLLLKELASERFVVIPHSSASPGHGMLLSLCQQAGFEPQIVQEVDSISSMFNLISVDMGVGLSVIGPNFSYPSPLRVVPLKDVEYTTTFVLGWLKGRSDPLVEALLESLKVVSSAK